MRMSRFRQVLLLPLLGTFACLNAPGRATSQDVHDASVEAGDAQPETAADALELDVPGAPDEAPDGVAPDGEDASFDLRPHDETAEDEGGDADGEDTPGDAAENADVADPPAEVAPEVAPDAPSDPGTDGETVEPPSVRCAGRTGSGGIVGANGVWLRGTVGGGVRALRVGE